jgi:hypothetical protein
MKSVMTGASKRGVQQLLDHEWENYHPDIDYVQ